MAWIFSWEANQLLALASKLEAQRTCSPYAVVGNYPEMRSRLSRAARGIASRLRHSGKKHVKNFTELQILIPYPNGFGSGGKPLICGFPDVLKIVAGHA